MPINKRTVEEKKLKQQNRISVKEGAPSKSDGIEGELTIRKIKGKGVFIFVKVDGIWRSRALYRGIAESATSSPGKDIALIGWNPERKVYEPLDTSEIFTRKTRGGKSKLTLGSSKAKASGSSVGNPGRLQLGDDKVNVGHLALGDAGTDVNVDNESGSISVGAIDDGYLGHLRLFAGSITQVNRRTILRAGGSLGADVTTTFRIESENSYIGTDSDSHGALLKLRRIGTGATVEAETKMGSLYCQGADDDSVLHFKNQTGTITALSALSASQSTGMILGYTAIGIDATTASYDVTDAFVTINSGAKVTFVAPLSGNVEIFASVFDDASAGRQLFLGLSDNATYNTVNVTHEHEVWQGHSTNTEEFQINHTWVITGLTAGTSYTYWIGAKASHDSVHVLRWGGDATAEHQPFIIKATSLPSTIYDGS
jgi:hypothetical protein